MAISYTLLPRGVNRVSAGSSVNHESTYVPSRARQHERYADAEDMPQLRDIFLAEFIADNRCDAHRKAEIHRRKHKLKVHCNRDGGYAVLAAVAHEQRIEHECGDGVRNVADHLR